MKNASKCIKCEGDDIIKIKEKRGMYGGGNFIGTDYYHVSVTRYLCVSCGYSEEWVDSSIDRNNLKKKYSKK